MDITFIQIFYHFSSHKFKLCATLGTTGACAFDDLTQLGPVCKYLYMHYNRTDLIIKVLISIDLPVLLYIDLPVLLSLNLSELLSIDLPVLLYIDLPVLLYIDLPVLL